MLPRCSFLSNIKIIQERIHPLLINLLLYKFSGIFCVWRVDTSSPHPCVQNDVTPLVTPTRKHVTCIRRFSPELQGKLSTYARFSLEISFFSRYCFNRFNDKNSTKSTKVSPEKRKSLNFWELFRSLRTLNMIQVMTSQSCIGETLRRNIRQKEALWTL